ncbi:hypothetical protein [Nocardia salmonicida]|uniref:hypothetical protein n=1 Tax=Nocardia salmonicida TaxID=53431 RepID=UPI0034115B18
MVEIPVQAWVAIPGALLALVSLRPLVPLGTRRWHSNAVDRLAKVVSAAGPGHPSKMLKVKLEQEANWVAATYAIRLSRSDIVYVVATVGSTLGALAVVAVGAKYWPAPFGGRWLSVVLGLISGAATSPVTSLLMWVRARRRMYAKLGGRIVDVPKPSRWPMSGRPPGKRVVDGWIRAVFDTTDPATEAIKLHDMNSLRGEIQKWEHRPALVSTRYLELR